MRRSSVAVAAVAFASAAFAAVPATASTPVRDASDTPMCTTAQLSVALGGHDAGAGNLYSYLVFTNTSGTECHLTGYPGVSMLDANGKQIGEPATRQQYDYAPVVLAPGAAASDTIHTVDQEGPCLTPSTKLRIYPPGNTASVAIPAQITECYNTFTVTPLAAGPDGNPPNTPPTPTPTATSTTSGGSPSATPTQSATAAPTPSATVSAGSPQVSAVPSGAPDTGMPESSGGGSDRTAMAAGGGAVVLAAALGTAVVRRRRSQARG